MGCDIHLYTEKLIEWENKEFWWCVDYWQLNDWKTYNKNVPAYNHVSIYNDRNYDLFAALADVRNYGYIKPIDEPRGLPDDVSKAVKKESDKWEGDGHSHSWITAKELFNYQKKYPVTKQSGFISTEQAQQLEKKSVIPSSWCQWTSNPNYVYKTWTRQESPVDGLVRAVKAKMKDEFYIFDFQSIEEQEKKLWENANKFRLVYWFDN